MVGMEWIFTLSFSILALVLAGIYILRKLLKLAPSVSKLQELKTELDKTKTAVVELEATASALSDDPMIHAARRAELLRKNRQLKLQRERRLRNRNF